METHEYDKGRLAEQYDRLAGKFNDLYVAGKERGRESMTVAMDKAHDQLAALGEFSSGQGQKLKQYLARDLDQAISFTHHVGEEARDRLNPARLGAGALSSLASALEASSDALHTLGDKTKQSLTYKTGEITSAGTLTCQSCEQKVHLKHTGHVPPCPKCKGTLFEKGY